MLGPWFRWKEHYGREIDVRSQFYGPYFYWRSSEFSSASIYGGCKQRNGRFNVYSHPSIYATRLCGFGCWRFCTLTTAVKLVCPKNQLTHQINHTQMIEFQATTTFSCWPTTAENTRCGFRWPTSVPSPSMQCTPTSVSLRRQTSTVFYRSATIQVQLVRWHTDDIISWVQFWSAGKSSWNCCRWKRALWIISVITATPWAVSSNRCDTTLLWSL